MSLKGHAQRLPHAPAFRHFVRAEESTTALMRFAVCGRWVTMRESKYRRDEITCPNCQAWLRLFDQLQPSKEPNSCR